MAKTDDPTLSELVALLSSDQRQRWLRGERPWVEEYAREQNNLSDKHGALLDLVYHEICLRAEVGEPAACEEYLRRFPQYEVELRALFEIHNAIESDGLAESIGAVGETAPAQVSTVPEISSPDAGSLPTERLVVASTAGDLPHRCRPDSRGREGSQLADGSVLRQFGDYELLSVIAEGGMGIVYRARHVTLERTVALKMIRAGEMASRQDIERFRAEALTAGSLQHPGIVAVHDVGEVSGQHFFTMDYVAGQDLKALMGGHPLRSKDAANYVHQVAEAIHAAHQHGILHRDLKPGNVLIDEHNRPRVTDFGFAKRCQSDAQLTVSGEVFGTPSYMSPEQARGDHAGVDYRSDVYSLGALLYELVTGRPPFRAASILETMRQVLHTEPVRPRLLNPHIDRDLETICLKCLEKEPHRRYASIQELADDVRRYLHDDPITARRVSAPERAWRICRKNPVAASFGLLTVTLLLAIAVAGPLVAVHQSALRKLAEQERREADLQRERVEQQLRITTAHRLTAQAKVWLEQYPQRAILLAVEAVEVSRRAEEPAVPVAEEFLRQAVAEVAGVPLPDFRGRATHLQFSPDGRWLAASVESDEVVRLWDVGKDATKSSPRLLPGHDQGVAAVCFTPDSHRLITSDWQGKAYAWTLDDEVHSVAVSPQQLSGHEQAIYEMAVSPDGQWLATAGGDSYACVWDLTAADLKTTSRRLDEHQERITDLTISPDSRWLVTTSVDGTARVWDLPADNVVSTRLDRPDETAFGAKFSLDGRWLVTLGSYGPESSASQPAIGIWDMRQTEQSRGHQLSAIRDAATLVEFDPRGRWLLSAGEAEPPQLWDLASADPSRTPLRLLDVGVAQARFSVDGRWLVVLTKTAGLDDDEQQVWMWELERDNFQDHARVPVAGSGRPVHVEFDRSGQWLIVGSNDGSVTLYDRTADEPWGAAQRWLGHEGTIDRLEASPDGRWLATGGGDDLLRLWNLQFPGSNDVVRSFPLGGRIEGMELSPDGRWLATGDGQAVRVWRWNENAPATVETLRAEMPIATFGFSPDSQRLLAVDTGGTVQIWAAPFEPISKPVTIEAHKDLVQVAAVSPDSRWLLTGSEDRTARLWDLATGGGPQLLAGHERAVLAATFHPLGRRCATGGADGTIRIWQRGHPDPVATLSGHAGPVFFLTYSADGRWLVSASLDGTARFWSAASSSTEETYDLLHAEKANLDSLVTSPDRTRLVSTTFDGGAHVWDLTSPSPTNDPLLLPGHPGTFAALAISSDNHFLASVGADGTVRLWDTATAASVVLGTHTGPAVSLCFTPDGDWLLTAGAGQLRLWRVSINEVLDTAKSISGRALSPAERRTYLDEGWRGIR